MFAEAIFWREITESARRRKLYWAYVGYLGLLFLGLVAAWVTEAWADQAVASGVGYYMLAVVFEVQCAMALILAPAYVAATLIQEKHRNTYWTLFLSRLSVFEIVIGKLLSCFVPLLLLLLSGLPIMVFIMDLDRLAMTPLLGGFACVTAAFLLGGGVGACFGAICTSLYGAILLSYSFLAILASGLLWLHAYSGIPAYLSMLPFAGVLGALRLPPATLKQLVFMCGPSLLSCASLCAVMSVLAACVLYRYAPGSHMKRPIWMVVRIDLLFNRIFPTLWRFGLRKPDHVKAEALAWREAALSSAGIRGAAKITFCLTMLATAVTAVVFRVRTGTYGTEDMAVLTMGGAMLFLAVHVTLTASLCISRELERGTLDLMLMLPVEPEEIVRAQFAGVMSGTVLPLGFFILYCLTISCAGLLNPLAVVAVPIVLWMALRFFVTIGMALSITNKTEGRSTIAGITASLILGLGIAMFTAACGALHEDTVKFVTRSLAPEQQWCCAINLLLGGLIWCGIAAFATNRMFREVLYRFDRLVHER